MTSGWVMRIRDGDFRLDYACPACSACPASQM